MVFSEDSRVKIPCILHLMRLGYRYLSLKDAVWDIDTNILPVLFNEAIARINPELLADDVTRLLADVKLLLDNEDLGKAFYDRLTERSGSLGTKVKDGKNQKTLLATAEEDRIIATFNSKEAVEDFAVVVSYADIAAKNYSLSAGQYFEVKIEYSDLTPAQFAQKMQGFSDRLDGLFKESAGLEKEIKKQLAGSRYE